MIATISNGATFGGIVNYANDIVDKDTEILKADGVNTMSNKGIMNSFKLQAKMNPRVKNCVGHFSLSFSPEDHPRMTNGFICRVSQDFMQRMGYTNTQFVIFRHKDHAHDHVHVVYNRVDNNGKTISDSHDIDRANAIAKAITREYGLTFGKNKNKVNRDRLKGKDKIKYAIYDAAKEALQVSYSWKTFIKAMKNRDIRVYYVTRPNGNGTGIIFVNDNVTFSGSRVDRCLSYNAINRVLDNNYKIREAYYNHTDYTPTSNTHNTVAPISESRNKEPESQCSSIPETVSDIYTVGDTDSESGSSIADSIGAAVVDLLLQPNVVPLSGGGGGSSRDNDDDDEKKKRKNEYRPRRGR